MNEFNIYIYLGCFLGTVTYATMHEFARAAVAVATTAEADTIHS